MADTPDFDNMTPEEITRWMESLAKRQGATEGLTTSADMEVDDVSEDDERLAGQGDYIPYGWTKEKWDAHLAKEAEERAARAAASAQPPEPEPEPEPAQAAAPQSSGDMPDFDNMTPEEITLWMESLAKRQGVTEGLTTAADMTVDDVSEDDERLAGQGDYIPYGWTKEQWEAQLAKEAAQRAARQQPPQEEDEEEAYAGDVLQAPSLDDLFGTAEPDAETAEGDVLQAPSLDDLFGADEPDEEDEEEAYAGDVLQAPSLDALFGTSTDEAEELPDFSQLDFAAQGESATSDDPMDWLAGLSGQSDSDEPLQLDMDALGGLANLAGDEPTSDDELSWLAGLAGDEGEPAAPESDDDTLEWMETLARRQGAETHELITGGYGEAPDEEPYEDDSPGYEPFSFEEGTGTVSGRDDEGLEDLQEVELEDPAAWLRELESGAGSDDVDEDFSMAALDDDSAAADDSDEYESITHDVLGKMQSGGDISPEEMEAFFEAQFQRANERGDIPDYIDEEDDMPVADESALPAADIPDWLREAMPVGPSAAEEDDDEPADTPKKTDTAEMMIQELGLDEEDEDGIPAWLQEGDEADTGDIGEDIFATESADMGADIGEEINADPTGLPESAKQDNWVQAFVAEASGESRRWYNEQLSRLEGADADDEEEALAEAAELQSADLEPETQLPAGQPQAVPDWLRDDVEADDAEPSLAGADMEWLTEDETEAVQSDMPDWLREQVSEDSPAEVPSWLLDEGVEDIDPDEIPDWLRETMQEEESAVPPSEESAPVFTSEATPQPQPTPEPEPTPAIVPAASSPAPVPAPARDIDVAATLKTAQQKISGGDVDSAMQELETVVRANAALDQVESALRRLLDHKDHKKNPTVHRVMGDTLMRQGKLQEALDTYRKALNLL